MEALKRFLLALVLGVALATPISPALANEPCAYYGTIYDGTPFARYFGTVCGQANIDATWPSVEAHMNANRVAYEAFIAQQAAAQQAQQAAEAARLAEEEAARQAAAAVADAANCVDAVTVSPGTQWQRIFPAVCTAAGIQARSEEIQMYSANVASMQANLNPNVPVNPSDLDCNLEVWRNTAICLNQGAPPPPPPAPVLVVNPDGSLNCANPVNINLAQCNGSMPTPQVCALPQNAALPACINSQPMYNSDGSINCAQPANATMAACINLFSSSSNGALDCSRPELQNMPICRVNSVTTNAPTQNLNPLPSTPQLPVTTQGPSVAPTAASAVGTSRVPANNSEQTNKSENTPTKSNSEKIFAEDEGEEEEPAGSISVTYSRAQGSYLISINSNLAGERVTVRASKKGAKSLRFNVSIDEDGEGGVKTKRNLSGFTLALYYGNTKLGEVKAR